MVTPARGRSSLHACAAGLTLFALALPGLAAADSAQLATVRPEDTLMESLDEFRGGDVDTALERLRALITAKPNFRLAQLMYGDMLAIQAGQPPAFAENSPFPREAVNPLLAEVKQRWKRYAFDPGDRLPASLVELAEEQEYAIVIDMSLSRLFVFRNDEGKPKLIEDYYVSGGKNGAGKERAGDRRTPLGVYFVTDHLPGTALPDRYGLGAFPVDYPNDWDQRNGRTGSGIWLHGVSSATYSRPPLDSDGCITMSNDELAAITPFMETSKTPVIIEDKITWVSADDVAGRRTEMRQALESWRQDWESGDASRFMRHYARDFTTRDTDRAGWAALRRHGQWSRPAHVQLDELSIFAYPDEPDVMVTSFQQHLQARGANSVGGKRQYWRKDEGRWQIVFEDVPLTPQPQLRSASLSTK